MQGTPAMFGGLTSTQLAEPTTGDFTPGQGLSILTRLSPVALRAEGDTQRGNTFADNVIPIGTQVQRSPLVSVGVVIVLLLVVKWWTERKTDSHVADIRIGISQLFILALMVAVARHLSIGAAGLGVKYNFPYAGQAAKFFSL